MPRKVRKVVKRRAAKPKQTTPKSVLRQIDRVERLVLRAAHILKSI